MSGQTHRLASGGEIDRARPLGFSFDGRAYQGYAGDTLASALIANGVRLVGRSFKYHRPRGIYSIGPEEPNALVRLRQGGRAEPNTRATVAELYDGLAAESQHRWPSLSLDIGWVNDLLGPFIPSGFYYKTFMGPGRGAWMVYEKYIRKAAGLGTAAREPDPDRYEKRALWCDVLVVGGGPAGIAAALAAAETGARVVLADERASFGGVLRRERMTIGGLAGRDWAGNSIDALAARGNVTLLPRTTVFGYYDGNGLGAVERVQDHVPTPGEYLPRQRLWNIRARRVVLATGAIEQPLVFAGNDKPGVMLASAARGYVNQYAARPGTRAVIATGNDDAYRTAIDLALAGVEVVAVVDHRPAADGALPRAARARGIDVVTGHAVVGTIGMMDVAAVEIARIDPQGALADGAARQLACDLVCASGGWQPAVHLHSHTGAKPVFDDTINAFVPGPSRQAELSVGAARGAFALADCLADGLRAGAEAAKATGHGSGAVPPTPACEDGGVQAPARALWPVPRPPGVRGKAFVDIQDDVTDKDVALAHREGYVSVEHLKRYTTLGMGTDQGKISNLAGHAIMAGLRGQSMQQVGTTTFRPPYTPVAFAAFAGRELGRHYQPIRRTPTHAWHEANGATFIEAGLWVRPQVYMRGGEQMGDAIAREVRAVRGNLGICDVSTLGKIDVQGPDAAKFLDRVYCNTFSTLPAGRARYGLMLREDGIVMDDGTTSRLSEHRFFMTTTTANAGKVMTHLEYYLSVVWPELKVQVASVTEQWAGIAVAGPKSRELLQRAMTGVDLSNEALPFMGVRDGLLAGIPARVFRISFSGELAYEVNVPSDFGVAAWEALMAAGNPLDAVPYGLEAMGVMRIEKGHVVGSELDGRTTPGDLNMDRLVSKKKDFIGRQLMGRPGLVDPKRKRLVGLVPVDGRTRIRAGAQIVADPRAPAPVEMLGHVTSACPSASLNHPIALALVSGGLERKGQTLHAAFPLRNESVAVKVVDPVFVDPEGKRLHG